ncbi:MAG: hypothetical protein A3I66_04120 [Burkholderiales bacterium RIFCSPLOWO2_02_FULL_57_36]|nr:MAG: hypothetical protein A3I66_04120 [Burkholderiales bacterium RIFCSPLOWO2_02_FULL_57_36]
MNSVSQANGALLAAPDPQPEHELQRENPCFTNNGWDGKTYDIQAWLERAPWRTLRNTEYGYDPAQTANPVLWEDPLINEIYKLDIATFLTAEEVSVSGISKLVSQAPDEASRIFLATQTLDEARHYEIFCRRLADFGVAPAERNELISRVTTREMKEFYDLIREQANNGDYVGALVAHNIVLEGMAYPVYRYEIKYWSKLDPCLSRMIQSAFADEVRHVGFGEAFIANEIRRSPDVRNRVRALTHDCNRLMTSMFEAVIHKYIGLYQEAANAHMDLMGDIQIFPGMKMADVSEEDQVRQLLFEIQTEYKQRLAHIGLTDN